MSDDYMVTWRELITEAMKDYGHSWSDVVSLTLSDEDLDRKFDCGYGGVEGVPFTVWTADRVYFPRCYDGAEGVASVARNPDGKPTQHVGGG